MAYKTIHTKQNGIKYVYSVDGYWDKEKKAPRNRQVCLGRLDETTGEVIPSVRKIRTEKRAASVPEVTASTKVYGPHLLLAKLANDTGLTAALKKCFPEFHDEILSLAFFITQKGLPLSRSEAWSVSHQHPYCNPISSQAVSRLLQHITENDRQHFLSLWVKRLSENDLLCYDITSISSYASGNEYVRWGYNRDKEKLPQINLAMLFGQKSGLPAYYRRMPGFISDVTALRTTIETLDFLGKAKLNFVLDRGFYSERNVNSLLDNHYHFILAVPTGRKWVIDILDNHYEETALLEHYRNTGADEALYMVSHLHKWGERRCYLHLYYSATRAAEDYDKLNRKLISCKEEIETGNKNESNAELYERFFITKNTPKRGMSVSYNEMEIQKYRKRYAGFFCILTNVKMDSTEVLDIYRRKDIVENCFDDLKNGLDMKRLRIHSSEAMDNRLFIQFLALILMSQMRTIAKENRDIRYMTLREIMEAMELIVKITYSGRYGSAISETGPLQKTIIDAFGLDLTT
jgi:transposase